MTFPSIKCPLGEAVLRQVLSYFVTSVELPPILGMITAGSEEKMTKYQLNFQTDKFNELL